MTRQTSKRSLKAILGVALSAVGLLLLFVSLDNTAASFNRQHGPIVESLGGAFELGLAGMRAAQAYFFDHPSFQSGLQQILVSFWPLLLVICGAGLLRNAVGRRSANGNSGLPSRTAGAHE